MSSDCCVVCSRKVSSKQHALQCDSCTMWQHRVCNTGLSLKDYRQMMHLDTFSFTCETCQVSQEETMSGPADSTHLNQSLEQPDYGVFNISVITAASSTSTSLNTTYIVDPDPAHTSTADLAPADTTDPAPADTTDPAPADTTDPASADTTDPAPADTTEDLPAALTHAELTASFDVTRNDIPEPPEILEDSLREPDLPGTILPDVPLTYTIVEQGTQRKGFKLVSSDGYEYTKKSSKGNFTYWRCITRSKTANCPATVSQKGSTYKMNSRQHIHQADKGALKKVVIMKQVKTTAKQDIHKPARRVVEDAMLDNIEPGDHQLPKVNNLIRMTNQVRENLRPEEPKDINFVIDTEYLQSNNFLIGDIHVDTERHIMFATPVQLQMLQYAKRWFCDGTFKVLPKKFQQMWSIHAFIRKGDSIKQIPLVFCLMSRRKTRDYVAVFQRLKEVINGNLHVQGFVVDFETGAWKAIRQEFANTTIKGCAFHFNQAVWRKTQELGLKTTYSKRGPEYRYIRSLMGLPFLPSTDIQSAFDQLAPRATSPELTQLVNYIDNTWISSTVWLPRTWSIYQLTIRTNNDVEGWHSRINKDIGRAHPSFYVLVPALKREAFLVDLSLQLVTEEQILRDQRSRFRELQGRLHQYWAEYEDGQRTASHLLRDCGKVYGPTND